MALIVRKVLTEFAYSTNVGTKVTISIPERMIGTLIPETVQKYTPHTLSVFPDVLTAIHFLHHCASIVVETFTKWNCHKCE